MSVERFLHHSGSFFEHFCVCAHVVKIRKRAVPGNHFHVGRKLRSGLFHRFDDALRTAAAGHVNKGKTVTHEIVAHVHDVILREENDGVAIGVARRKVHCANVFTIQVHRHVVLERDNRQRRLCSGLVLHFNRSAIARRAAGLQAFAHIVVGDQRGARGIERLVAAGMVAVIVGVDDEAHGLVRDADVFQRGLNLLRERGELVVHDHDAVLAD